MDWFVEIMGEAGIVCASLMQDPNIYEIDIHSKDHDVNYERDIRIVVKRNGSQEGTDETTSQHHSEVR